MFGSELLSKVWNCCTEDVSNSIDVIIRFFFFFLGGTDVIIRFIKVLETKPCAFWVLSMSKLKTHIKWSRYMRPFRRLKSKQISNESRHTCILYKKIIKH